MNSVRYLIQSYVYLFRLIIGKQEELLLPLFFTSLITSFLVIGIYIKFVYILKGRKHRLFWALACTIAVISFAICITLVIEFLIKIVLRWKNEGISYGYLLIIMLVLLYFLAPKYLK